MERRRRRIRKSISLSHLYLSSLYTLSCGNSYKGRRAGDIRMIIIDEDIATMIDVLIHYICDPDVPLAYGDTTIEEAEALLKKLRCEKE